MNRYSTVLILVLVLCSACAYSAFTHGTTISAKEAWAKIKGGALVLDVRTPGEFRQGHIEGAVNIPYDEIAQRLTEIGDTSREIVMYCRSGNRSSKAKATLEKNGYQKVYNGGGFEMLVTSSK